MQLLKNINSLSYPSQRLVRIFLDDEIDNDGSNGSPCGIAHK